MMTVHKRIKGAKLPEVPLMGEVIQSGPVLELHVDISKLTWGDYKTLNEFSGKVTPEVYDLLDRIVVGGISKLPLIGSINPILEAISEAIEDASMKQPPGTAKKNGQKMQEPETPNRGN